MTFHFHFQPSTEQASHALQTQFKILIREMTLWGKHFHYETN